MLVTRKLTTLTRARALRLQKRKDRGTSLDGDPELFIGEEEDEEDYLGEEEQQQLVEDEQGEEVVIVEEEEQELIEEEEDDDDEEMEGHVLSVKEFFQRLWDGQHAIDERIRREEERLAEEARIVEAARLYEETRMAAERQLLEDLGLIEREEPPEEEDYVQLHVEPPPPEEEDVEEEEEEEPELGPFGENFISELVEEEGRFPISGGWAVDGAEANRLIDREIKVSRH